MSAVSFLGARFSFCICVTLFIWRIYAALRTYLRKYESLNVDSFSSPAKDYDDNRFPQIHFKLSQSGGVELSYR